MSNYTSKVMDVLTEACGHPDEYSPFDQAVQNLAVQADDEIARQRVEIERACIAYGRQFNAISKALACLDDVKTAALNDEPEEAGSKVIEAMEILAMSDERFHDQSVPTKGTTEYRRASDARGPAQTKEKAESSRHEGSGDACAGWDHRAPDPRRLRPGIGQ